MNCLKNMVSLLDNLAEEVGKDYGDFDLICHIAYDQPPLTRKERANNVKNETTLPNMVSRQEQCWNALLR